MRRAMQTLGLSSIALLAEDRLIWDLAGRLASTFLDVKLGDGGYAVLIGPERRKRLS